MGPLGRNQADEKSPVTGDCHAGICGSRGVQFPPATRPATRHSSLVVQQVVLWNCRCPGATRPIDRGANMMPGWVGQVATSVDGDVVLPNFHPGPGEPATVTKGLYEICQIAG